MGARSVASQKMAAEIYAHLSKSYNLPQLEISSSHGDSSAEFCLPGYNLFVCRGEVLINCNSPTGDYNALRDKTVRVDNLDDIKRVLNLVDVPSPSGDKICYRPDFVISDGLRCELGHQETLDDSGSTPDVVSSFVQEAMKNHKPCIGVENKPSKRQKTFSDYQLN